MVRRADPRSTRAIALHKLPVQLRMLVRVLGEADAFRLIELRGGTPLTMPRRDVERLPIDVREALSPMACAALVAELGGQTLQLPKNDSVLRQIRHQRVLALRQGGMRLAQVALTTGLTVRWVIEIWNRSGLDGLAPADLDDAEAQHDMFGFDDADAAAPTTTDTPDTPPVTAHNPFGL